jgi:hypothetical protein
MRIYYRGPDAIVTDEHFVWRTTSPRAVPIRDLRSIGLGRGEIKNGRSTLPVAIGAATLALATAAWLTFDTGLSYGLIAGAISGAVLTLTTWHRRNLRSWQLRAIFRGTQITLYSCTDERVFNQVTRALRRTMEEERRSRPARRLATVR